MSSDRKQVYNLLAHIYNVIANNGSFTTYTDMLINNDNQFPSLATKYAYDHFQQTFDNVGRIVIDDIDETIKLPVTKISLDTKKPSVEQPELCSTADTDEVKNLCDCFRIANAYRHLVQTYIIDLEDYAVNMALVNI